MQVFLPYPDLSLSVRCLDKSRMGNQVWREAKTLISGGWKNHPASKMFRGFEPALAQYCLHGMCQLVFNGWVCRQKAYSLRRYFQSVIDDANGNIIYPPWFTNQEIVFRVCRSHQLALLWKAPAFYSKYNWGPIPSSQPEYFWPV